MPTAVIATRRGVSFSAFIMVFTIAKLLSLLLRLSRKAPTKASKKTALGAVGELSVEFIQWQFEIR